MSISLEQLQAVAVGSQENRVEGLRLLLGYPLKQRDPEGSRFWFLRPGVDEDEAEDTCPIAIGFYSELNHLSKDEIPQFLTADEGQKQIYGHYTQRIVPNQPVMYLLLPEGGTPKETAWQSSGRVAMILPSEGKLRQRQIQTFTWTEQDLQARLFRLQQTELARTDRMQEKALAVIPLVEWAFYKPIETAKELATKLAEVSRKIEQAIPAVYIAERSDGYLHSLLTSFQRELLPTLKLKADNDKDYSFADIYAQTISYGLFTARVFSYTVDERKRQEEQNPGRKETDFNRQNAWELLPETNPFLRRLFKDVSQQPVTELGEDLVDAISEVFSILRAAKMEAILADFRAKMNREDIVIRFYEDFLAAYKPKMRERRGVYYTPEPVVSYMVRSVDILLKEKFAKPLGLADPEVMILDPACGTGTFLLWIFQLIHQRFQENSEALTAGLEDKSWSGYVKERLLPRVFGFELLMAPYAIAHLKLGLFLEETGYQFDGGKRLGVYLTNALEQVPPDKPEIPFEEFIAAEGEAALSVKKIKPIMLIIGNPPYSTSLFEGTWIMNLMEDYKEGLSEKKSDLNREEWKFFRFSQEKIKGVQRGIVSFVVNNTFIDAITYWSLRKNLMSTFNEISIADLHGSVNKQERCPDGSKDEGVFDIKQGVTISLFSRNTEQQKPFSLNHIDLWGLRSEKYNYLNNNDVSSTKWTKLNPAPPQFFLSNRILYNHEELHDAWSIGEIFKAFGSGIKTDRDPLFLDFISSDLEDKMQVFYSDKCLDSYFAKMYRVENSSSYNLLQKRKETQLELTNVKQILYRPFDNRFIYYAPGLTSRPAWDVMQHMIHPNFAFIVKRQARENLPYTWFGVTDSLVIDGSFAIDNKGRERIAPLYLYPDSRNPQKSLINEGRQSNFSQEFLDAVFDKLGYKPTPETIFFYIYSIFHSPTYRTRYSESLKIDFPRIPLTSNDKLFHQLSTYGEELVALHLMKSSKLDNLITKFVETSSNCIVDPGHPKYDDNSNSVLINKKGDKFTEVPKAVWEFYIGGYQVCHKWLKDRKGRTLSEEDITHYQRIVVALQETIRLMQKIDEAIPGFPLE